MKVKTRKLEKTYRRQRSVQSEKVWRAQFKNQRELFQRKFMDHWSHAIDESQGDSKVLWSKLRMLLQPEPITTSRLTADDYARYFESKIDRIRASTAAAPPPTIVDRQVDEQLSDFQPVTVDEVMSVLKRSPAKQCQLDPAPTWLIKRASDVIAPVIARMCNASFEQAKLPGCSKKAIVRPLLKKPTLDPDDLASYRPISNLSFVSKVVERVVDTRLTKHATKHQLLPVYQSAYRPHHSTETAIVSILNDIIMICAVDQGQVGAQMLLDLSAAFDTVDHHILMAVLQRRCGVQGKALEWLGDFLRTFVCLSVRHTPVLCLAERKQDREMYTI